MSEPSPLRAIATEIVRRVQAAGFTAYFVGGCVRDQLLGKEPHDFDITTDARPDDVEKIFPRTIPVGRQFGVMIVLESGHQFQIATFRAEADYRDGRHPETVQFADAIADARRRDFTVNGLYLDPIANQIHDWVGGEADLRAKTLRTIGDPQERFSEDHLRLLRAVRFAAQLSFEIEPATFAAVKANAAKILSVSAERIRDELLKLFRPPHAARGLELLRGSGLMDHILPELSATVNCEQSPPYHPEGSVFNHLCLMLSHLPPDAPESLPWTILMHDIAKPLTVARHPANGQITFYGHEKIGADMAEAILQRLKFPRKQTEEIVECVLHHMQFKDVKQMRKATLRRLLMRETFPLELELHRIDCLGSNGNLEHYEFMKAEAETLAQQPALRPPLLTGEDLKQLGVAPGPVMGELLAELREKQLADELTDADQARMWIKSRLSNTSSN